MNRPMPRDAVDGKRAAEELGIPYSRLRYWWQSKRIGSWRIGHHRLVSLAEVSAYHRANTEPRYTGPPTHGAAVHDSADDADGADEAGYAE